MKQPSPRMVKKRQKMKESLGKRNVNHIHPNHLTILSLALAIFGYIISFSMPWLSFVLFAFALMLDALDGWYARQLGMQTVIGAFLDGIIDRIVELSILLAIWPYSTPTLWIEKNLLIVINLFFGTCLTSFIKSYAISKNALPISIIKKGDKAIPCILPRWARALMYLFAYALLFINPFFTSVFLLLSALLSFITCLQEVIFVLQATKQGA